MPLVSPLMPVPHITQSIINEFTVPRTIVRCLSAGRALAARRGGGLCRGSPGTCGGPGVAALLVVASAGAGSRGRSVVNSSRARSLACRLRRSRIAHCRCVRRACRSLSASTRSRLVVWKRSTSNTKGKKVQIRTLEIAPLREPSRQNCSGMARVLKGSHFYVPHVHPQSE